MVVFLRNICNKRANESIIVLQNDGTLLEKPSSPNKDTPEEKVWPSISEWMANLQNSNRLGSVHVYNTTPRRSPQLQPIKVVVMD